MTSISSSSRYVNNNNTNTLRQGNDKVSHQQLAVPHSRNQDQNRLPPPSFPSFDQAAAAPQQQHESRETSDHRRQQKQNADDNNNNNNNNTQVQIYSKNHPQHQEQYNNLVHPHMTHSADFASSYTYGFDPFSAASPHQQQQQQIYVAKPSSTADRVQIRNREDYVRCISNYVASGMTKEELKIQATYDDLEVDAPSQELRSSWWWRNKKSVEHQFYKETDNLPRVRPPILFRNQNVKVFSNRNLQIQQQQQQQHVEEKKNQNDDEETSENHKINITVVNQPSVQYHKQIFDLVHNRRDDGFHYRNGVYDHQQDATQNNNGFYNNKNHKNIMNNAFLMQSNRSYLHQNNDNDADLTYENQGAAASSPATTTIMTPSHSNGDDENQEAPMTVSKNLIINNNNDNDNQYNTSDDDDHHQHVENKKCSPQLLLLPPLPFSQQQAQKNQELESENRFRHLHGYFVAFRAHKEWFQYNPAQLRRDQLERERKIKRGESLFYAPSSSYHNNNNNNNNGYHHDEPCDFDDFSYNSSFASFIIRDGDFVVVQGDNGGFDIGKVLCRQTLQEEEEEGNNNNYYKHHQKIPHILGLADQNQIQLLQHQSDCDALSVMQFLDSLPYDLIHLRNIVEDFNNNNNNGTSLHQARLHAQDSLLAVYPHCAPSESAIREILDLFKIYNFLNAEFQFDKTSLCIYFTESRRHFLRDRVNKQKMQQQQQQQQQYSYYDSVDAFNNNTDYENSAFPKTVTTDPIFVMEDEDNFYYHEDFGSLITCLYRKFGCRIWLINCSKNAPLVDRHPFHHQQQSNQQQHEEEEQQQQEQVPVYPTSGCCNKINYLDPEEIDTDNGGDGSFNDNIYINNNNEHLLPAQENQASTNHSHYSIPSVNYNNNSNNNIDDGNNHHFCNDNEEQEQEHQHHHPQQEAVRNNDVSLALPSSSQKTNNNRQNNTTAIFGTQTELNHLFQRRREQFQRNLMRPVFENAFSHPIHIPHPHRLTARHIALFEADLREKQKNKQQEEPVLENKENNNIGPASSSSLLEQVSPNKSNKTFDSSEQKNRRKRYFYTQKTKK